MVKGDGEEEDERFVDMLEGFLKRYEAQIGRAIDGWTKNMEKEPERKLRIVLAIVLLVAFSVFALAWLTLAGKVSGDAFAFLIGSVIGYLFSYLRLTTHGRG